MAIFRYTEDTVNNYYAYMIEGHGDDANDGLTPETAVATLDRLVEILDTYAGANRRHAVIVKKRIYNEGITYVRNTSKSITFEFVGRCEINGGGSVFLTTGIVGDRFINADFLNYVSNIITSNGSASYGTFVVTFINCTINRCIIGAASRWGKYSMINTVCLNSTFFIDTNYNVWLKIENCVLINNSQKINETQSNRITIKNTIIQNANHFNGANYDFTDTDFLCLFNATINNKTLTQLQNEDNLFLRSISINPQFTNPTNGQYTVTSASPCLYRGEGGKHIGIGEGISLSAGYIYNNAEVIDNFEVKNQKLIRVNDASDGLLETYILDLGGTRSVMSLDLSANLGFLVTSLLKSLVIYSEGYIEYDSLANYHTGASVTDGGIKYRSLEDNNLGNTPASSPAYWKRMTWDAVSYPAGEIKQYTDDKWYKSNTITSTSWVAGEWDQVVIGDFLTFQMKFGRTFALAQASPWVNFPFNMLLEVDSMGRGSMDDDFDLSTAATIRFNYFKLRIHAKTIR